MVVIAVSITGLNKMRRLEESESYYKTALEINPGYWDAMANLGDTLMKMGHHKRGLAHSRQGNGVIVFHSNPNTQLKVEY